MLNEQSISILNDISSKNRIEGLLYINEERISLFAKDIINGLSRNPKVYEDMCDNNDRIFDEERMVEMAYRMAESMFYKVYGRGRVK